MDEPGIEGDLPDDEIHGRSSLVRDTWLPSEPSPVPSGTSATIRAGALRRRRLSHDIHHELGTIAVLAALLGNARDVGPDSRGRADLILRELGWLEQLLQAYEDSQPGHAEAGGSGPQPTRLDLVAAEVAGAIGLSCTARIELRAEEVSAPVEPLAYWRALRNLVQNAVRAAGPAGTVAVRLASEAGWAVTDVDDDGPGFDTGPPRSLGLDIVREFALTVGGSVHLGRSRLGGAGVRLRLPAADAHAQMDAPYAATGLVL